MSKTPSTAKLKLLPEEQQMTLADWLLGGMPYYQARALVSEKFGVEVKSLNTFSEFYRDVCAPLLLARRRRAVETANSVAKEAQSRPGLFDQATIDALKQRAFDLAIKPSVDPEEVKAVYSLVLKARDQELKLQEMELEREKFRESIRTNIDRGLEALYQEISKNQVARELFERFKAAVLKEVKATK